MQTSHRLESSEKKSLKLVIIFMKLACKYVSEGLCGWLVVILGPSTLPRYLVLGILGNLQSMRHTERANKQHFHMVTASSFCSDFPQCIDCGLEI